MRFHSRHHVHRNSATDRTQHSAKLSHAAAIILSVLVAIPTFIPTVAALSVDTDEQLYAVQFQATAEEMRDTRTLPDNEASLLGKRSVLSPAHPETMTEDISTTLAKDESENTVNTPEASLSTDNSSLDEAVSSIEEEEDIFDPSLPLTQELIARRIETKMDMQVRGGSRIYYPYPAGAMAVDLYKDGKRILKGQVADIGGTVYVPVQRFADLFGSFKTVYTEATEQVVITGTNLSITVKVGDPYITVNERIFYTGKKVISLGGWIFVPLTSMCKAVNAKVTIRSGYYDASITSGDPTAVKWASEYYNSTDLDWLSRSISAEAKGEPFAGQIAVGNVVLNRVRSSQFPNTVKGVIFDTKYGTQFSPVSSGTIYNTPTASAIRAAKICLEGYSLSTKMIYFYNPGIATSSWIGRTRPYIMTIGNHKFYG